jgi:protein SCO1/2
MTKSPAALAAVAGFLWTALAAAAPASGIPANEFDTFAFQQHPGAALPLDAVFQDSQGRDVPLRKFFGTAPVLLDFEYDHCTTLCGVMLDRAVAALAALPLRAGRDYRVLAVDIDPAATPSDAEAFLRKHGADKPGTVVLTGKEKAIRRLAQAAGFPFRRDEASGQFAHPAGFVIVTPAGHVARYLLGLDWRQLDLRLALDEAAEGKISAPADRVLLFCYCYNPKTGQYDVAVAKLLEVVGAATVLTLGGFIGLVVRSGGA